MRVSSPPFVSPCYYGTDIDSKDHLIAVKHTVDEIARIIGADSLGYLPTDRLCEMAGRNGLCTACFDGRYPTKVPDDTRKDRFEARLNQKK